MVRVGVLGAGYWGPNLIRNFAELPTSDLAAICDRDVTRRERVASRYPSAVAYADYADLLGDGSVDAVVVATPVANHYEHARSALLARKHVLVEKPLATTSQECLDLIRIAEERELVLMVGHTFLYNVAVHKIRDMIERGELGNVLYLYSQRVNLGIVRQDINAMWNLAPHDIAIVGYLTKEHPLRVAARGLTYLQPGLPDVVFMTIEYAHGLAAHVQVSWLDPQKIRKMTVVGSRKMVVYDDVSSDAKLQIYDKGIERVDVSRSHGTAPAFGEFQLLVRSGDLHVPEITFTEPLRGECAHFVDCIRNSSRPVSDGWNGLEVVAVLEAADKSLAAEGAWVPISPATHDRTHVVSLEASGV